MTEQALTITFSPATDLTDPYWLRMELVEPDDGQMTVGEAADFIDALFDVSICGQENPAAEPEEKPDGPDWDRAFALMQLPMCDNIAALDDGDPGAYDVQIKVYRSHQRELYKILLSNGTAGAPRRTEQRVTKTLDIENQSHVTLDMPIFRRPVVAWQDINGPDIHIMGNTLYWDGVVTGVLRAEFTTVYDLIDIHVHGIENMGTDVITGTDEGHGTGWYSGSEDGSELTDVQDIECTALAFYHYQYEELILHKPEIDESVTEDRAAAICRYAGSTNVNGPGFGDDVDIDDDGSKDCFKRVKYDTICICGGDKGTTTEDVPILCPPGHNTGSLVGRGEVEPGGYKYIDCGKDELNYEAICCVGWPFDDDVPFPDCEEHHAPFTGQTLTDEQQQDIKNVYGENVNIISVGPLEGRCGETITTQNIKQQSCCDEVTALLWDYDNSAEVIDPGSGAAVFVTGGQLPIIVKVRGDGFFLDAAHTIRDAVIDGRGIGIFADADACGFASIVVEDGCSDTGGAIKSTNGVWLDVEWHDGFCGCAGEYIGEAYGGNAFQCISGRYRLIEAARSAGSIPCGSCPTLTYVACMTKESLSPGGSIIDSSPCPNNDLWMVNYPSIGDRCREALSKHITEWSCP